MNQYYSYILLKIKKCNSIELFYFLKGNFPKTTFDFCGQYREGLELGLVRNILVLLKIHRSQEIIVYFLIFFLIISNNYQLAIIVLSIKTKTLVFKYLYVIVRLLTSFWYLN